MADIICYKPDGHILDYYTQWDVGQQLMIKGVDLSSAPYFYFTNSISDTAYVMPSEVSGGAVVVNVPDVLLQDAMPLIVYISYNQDSYIGTTEHTVRIPVMPRAKPNDYIYNPDSGGPGGGSGGSTGEAVGIANNLTTNDSTMALSAAQGVVLKAMVDTLDREKVNIDSLSNEIKSALDQAIEDGEIVGGQGEPGKDGAPGKDGRDGRGIESVLRSSGDGSPGTTDIYTITYSDDTTSTFSVYNGADGKDGTSASGGEGVAGENGATFTPAVTQEGMLSWTNDKGLANPSPINIMGPQGEKGEKGDKGDTGETGPQGEKGADGLPGENYVLTDADKAEIADMAAGLVKIPDSGGNVNFETDETLILKDGVLSVNTTNDMEQDNTLPITSAGVFATVGKIEALLKTI